MAINVNAPFGGRGAAETMQETATTGAATYTVFASSTSASSASSLNPASIIPSSNVQTQTATADDEPRLGTNQRFLYKGGWRSGLDLALPDRPDANPGLLNLATYSPTDFSLTVAWYFTTELDTAELYARYAHERAGGAGQAAILTLAVDNELLAGAVSVVGDQWRQFVWANRRQTVPRPDAIANLNKASLLVGPILCKNNKMMEKMDKCGKTYHDLRPLRFQNSDSSRSQYVVRDIKTIIEWSRRSQVWVRSSAAWSKGKDPI